MGSERAGRREYKLGKGRRGKTKLMEGSRGCLWEKFPPLALVPWRLSIESK